MRRTATVAAAAVFAGAVLATGGPAGATAFDPSTEAKNFAITLERQAGYDTPGYQAKMLTVGTVNGAHALLEQATDPGREFVTDLCWSGYNGCAGDVRLYNWASKGYGIVR